MAQFTDLNPEAARLMSEAIEQSGLGRHKVADLTGIPETTLRRKLMSRADINLRDISLVADALGIPAPTLLPASLSERHDEAA